MFAFDWAHLVLTSNYTIKMKRCFNLIVLISTAVFACDYNVCLFRLPVILQMKDLQLAYLNYKLVEIIVTDHFL